MTDALAPPHHHPDESILLDYVAGCLSTPFAAVIAAHLDDCPHCRREAVALEAIGGALLDDILPTPMSAGALDRMMAAIEAEDGPLVSTARPATAPGEIDTAALAALLRLPADITLPMPLASIVAQEIETYGSKHLKWSPLSTSLSQLRLKPAADGSTLRLIRAKGGARAPNHDHAGVEFTYVLGGGFSDESGNYAKGDLSIRDEGDHHRPVADPEGCLLVWASAGPIRLPGLLGLLLNRFIQ